MPGMSDIVKDSVVEFSRLQNWMLSTIGDIAEDEEFAIAMPRLICELNKRRRFGEEDGYISSDEVRAYFHGKRS